VYIIHPDQKDNTELMIIFHTSNKPEHSRVYYKLQSALTYQVVEGQSQYLTSLQSIADRWIHAISISGLSPNTTYTFYTSHTNQRADDSENYTFKFVKFYLLPN
jgi:hypothetical protein